MVKGVNKTVIEVNDTGSKMFEKIVFYVTPQYGSLNAKQLRRAAREFSFSFSGDTRSHSPKLKVKTKRRYLLLLVVGASGLLALITAFLLIF